MDQNFKLGELILSIKEGNVTAISKIYVLVGKAMLATAYSYVRNITDAEDVVQDALVKIVERASKFRTNKNASAWINTIVSNIAKNKLGYYQRRREVGLDNTRELTTKPDEISIIVNEIFDILTGKERQYIIYRFWYDCSFSEMAKIFHRSKTNVNDLYNLMGTNQDGAGTSGEQFKDGLKKFVNNHGYNLSYGSFYQDRTSVNINALQGMIANNKVGVLLCTKYNFIYDIVHGPNETFISKSDYTLAHMMMVYGYITIDYYKGGQIFRRDTYLQVSSGYSTGNQGYVLVDNNSMEIQEALIVNIS